MKQYKVTFVFNYKADSAWTNAETKDEAISNIKIRFPKASQIDVKGE